MFNKIKDVNIDILHLKPNTINLLQPFVLISRLLKSLKPQSGRVKVKKRGHYLFFLKTTTSPFNAPLLFVFLLFHITRRWMDKRLKSTGYFHATVRGRLYCPAVSSHASQLALSKCLAFILVIFQPVELFSVSELQTKKKQRKLSTYILFRSQHLHPSVWKKSKTGLLSKKSNTSDSFWLLIYFYYYYSFTVSYFSVLVLFDQKWENPTSEIFYTDINTWNNLKLI